MNKQFEIKIRRGLMEMLEECSLDEVNVKNLSEKTGLSKQAFYYHASNVTEYLCKRIARLAKKYADECGDNVNMIPEATRKAMEQFREVRPVCEGMMSSEHKLEYLSALDESVHKEMRKLVTRHLAKFRMEFDETKIKRISNHFADAVYGLLKADLLNNMQEDPAEICRDYKQIVGRAISIVVENYF